MAAAEVSHGPESKKRKQEAQEVAKSGFCDAGFARRGTAVARNADDVCRSVRVVVESWTRGLAYNYRLSLAEAAQARCLRVY